MDGRLVKVSVFMCNFIHFIYLSAQPVLLDITVNVLARGCGLKGEGGGVGVWAGTPIWKGQRYSLYLKAFKKAVLVALRC